MQNLVDIQKPENSGEMLRRSCASLEGAKPVISVNYLQIICSIITHWMRVTDGKDFSQQDRTWNLGEDD